ncbi:MAG TPA: hypothetical protein VLF16_15835 [Pseudomonas sp.]|nr:hypothetical protein [Pseudomonas sp.]
MDIFAAIYGTFASAFAGDGQSIALLGALYVCAVMLSTAIYLWLIWQWPSTRGQLLAQGVAPFGATELVPAQQNHVAKVAYCYEVDGHTYTGNRLSPWKVMASTNARFVLQTQLRGIQMDESGGVTVFYNPRKPARSYLIRSGPIKQALTLLSAIAPVALYLWVYR